MCFVMHGGDGTSGGLGESVRSISLESNGGRDDFVHQFAHSIPPVLVFDGPILGHDLVGGSDPQLGRDHVDTDSREEGAELNEASDAAQAPWSRGNQPRDEAPPGDQGWIIRTFGVRAAGPVDCILQDRGERTVVFGTGDHHPIGLNQLVAELTSPGGKPGSSLQIAVVEGHVQGLEIDQGGLRTFGFRSVKTGAEESPVQGVGSGAAGKAEKLDGHVVGSAEAGSGSVGYFAMRISTRVGSLRGSATLAVTARAKALRAEGRDVIGFGAGEPDFDTPDGVKAAAWEALQAGATKYAPTPGSPDLREAVARRMREHNGIDCGASDVVVTVGAKHAAFEVMQCLVDPGDEVVAITPAWLSYRPMVELAGGVLVECAAGLDDGFKATPESLKACLTERTAAVILNSPCNPTGVTYSPDEVAALAMVVAEHPTAVLVSDEIYEDLIYPEIDPAAAPFSPGSMPELADRTVTLNGLSKSMAMTGWRIGWAVAPGADGVLAKAMTRLQSQMTSGIPTFLMPAAVRAITDQPVESVRMREVFAKRAGLVAELLSGIDRFRVIPPSGAFYAFPDISACFGLTSSGGRRIDSAGSFAEALLEEKEVAVVPGDDFGDIARSHIRISFACSDDQIREGVGRIRDWVGELG